MNKGFDPSPETLPPITNGFDKKNMSVIPDKMNNEGKEKKVRTKM